MFINVAGFGKLRLCIKLYKAKLSDHVFFIPHRYRIML